MIKNLKIIIYLIVLSVFFSFNIALADDCDELRPILDKYYKAGQEENIEDYMAVMDANYLRENLIDNYEEYVKSAWEVYDTKDYEIESYNCKMEEHDALMYFNLSTTLLSNGQEVSTQRNYIALFNKANSWKIKYVMDEDNFSQFQDSLYTQLFLDATSEELTKAITDAEAVIEYAKIEEELLASDFENTISEGVPDRKNNQQLDGEGGNKIVYYLLFIIVLFVGGFMFVKKK